MGAGESGVGAAILARKLGMTPFVSDKGAIKEKYLLKLKEGGISFESGAHTEEKILSSALIIKSPGIPPDAPLLKKAAKKKIPVISEIEFAFRHGNGTIVAITGSNGKTTTSHLLYHLLTKAGLKVALAGNVGTSYAAKVAEGPFDYYVLEISSFQLEDISGFRPDISILLNITPDHLDRYEYKFSGYIDAKFRIVQNAGMEQYLIYNLDDEVITTELAKRKISTQLIPFSIQKNPGQGAWLSNNQLIINLKNNPFSMSIQELALQGKHNIYNSMAAAVAGRILELRNEVIRESLSDFQNVEHRLEFVMKVHGITFINDSKATNVNSAWYALESTPAEIIWIVGGIDKGNDYSQLMDLAAAKVKAIVCLGKSNKKIIKAFRDVVPVITECQSALDAVRKSYSLGKKGDTVLLSPACASFDLFESYEDRGRQFKAAVKSL